jgi:hypothetical protein
MFGTSPLLPRFATSQSDSSRVTALTPPRVSSTWMPITSEPGRPMTVTVRLLSYLVVRVPSYSESRCWNVL